MNYLVRLNYLVLPDEKQKLNNRNYYRTNPNPTSIHKNNETNDKFYRKVALLMYTEMVNFTPQS